MSVCLAIVGSLQHFSRCTLTHSHCANRHGRHEQASKISYHIYDYIGKLGAEERHNTTFKPSVVTPYLRWTELVHPYRCKPWINSILKSILLVHKRKSRVKLCCGAFFRSTQQCHVSHSKHIRKNETVTRHSDSMIRLQEIREFSRPSEAVLACYKNQRVIG